MHAHIIDDYHLILKKFIALSYCDVFDVCDRYRMLARQLLDLFGRTEQHQGFLDYFENTWVGRPHKDPRFPISSWNRKHVTESLHHLQQALPTAFYGTAFQGTTFL
ncbi:hypothetical protein HPB47_016429 [Ixodes persulcatus]|uniref:Uncharacterized protein n=1 Tax=Ixodes persulcatus TaxID=34615 RepID=A0AC60QR25_IXOPE|nr:hypothetical protein HPB47_016429 [Ixodes persulcatus]